MFELKISVNFDSLSVKDLSIYSVHLFFYDRRWYEYNESCFYVSVNKHAFKYLNETTTLYFENVYWILFYNVYLHIYLCNTYSLYLQFPNVCHLFC